MATLASVESWDEDQDFDFSAASNSNLSLDRSETGSRSSEAHEEYKDKGATVVRLKGQRGVDANDEEDIDGFDGDDDDEQGDTLKVSDLTSETLAQLASYAKKPSQHQSGARAPEQVGTFNDAFTKMDEDWTEGLEILDALSLRPLDSRKGSFASDVDFETPSLDSISDFTSSSYQSEALKSLGGPSTPYKNRTRGKLSSASSATSSSQLSPSRHAKQASVKRIYGHLSSARGIDEDERKGGNEDEAVISGAANTRDSSSTRLRVKSSSSGSVRSSDGAKTGADEGETYDDLTFDLSEADQDGAESLEKDSKSLAAHLQARLASRKGQVRSVTHATGNEDVHGLEKDFSSGLIIEDDLDISPGRLRARALSSRLREAAHNRRRKQGGRHQDERKASVALKTQSDPISVERELAGQSAKERSTGAYSSYHASTAASRAREAEIRASSPVQSMRAMPLADDRSTSVSPSRSASPFQSMGRQLASSPSGVAKPGRMSSPQPPHPYSRADGKASRDRTKKPAKVLRMPRRDREYGDGRELDAIEDFTTSNKSKSKSPLPPTLRTDDQIKDGSEDTSFSFAPSKKPRSRKKKQPHLIRNLGGDAGRTAKMVGDMRWNPMLKRWEGNEQEGREFDNAVRGTGRPALITRLSLGSSGIALGGAITTSPSQRLSSHPPHSSRELARPRDVASVPSGSPHVVGEMMFDPVQLRWIRQDGKEEADPFDEMWDLDVSDVDGKNDDVRQSDDESDRQTLAQRKVRQRTVSAEYRATVVEGECSATEEEKGVPTVPFGDVQRLIVDSLRSPRTSSQPPAQLREAIPVALWTASVEAQRRHEREMSGFFPSSVRQDSARLRSTRNVVGLGQYAKHTSPRPRPHSTAPDIVASAPQYGQRDLDDGGGGIARHLYLIQSLSRRKADHR